MRGSARHVKGRRAHESDIGGPPEAPQVNRLRASGTTFCFEEKGMYIRLEGDDHLLVRTAKGPAGEPAEIILANLGIDPELNLFSSAHQARREHPEHWEGVHDYHLLQALENYKRRVGHSKPALAAVQGGAPLSDERRNAESEE